MNFLLSALIPRATLNTMGTHKRDNYFEFNAKSINRDVWVHVEFHIRANAVKPNIKESDIITFDVVDIFTAYSDDILATYESDLELQKEVKRVFLNILNTDA